MDISRIASYIPFFYWRYRWIYYFGGFVSTYKKVFSLLNNYIKRQNGNPKIIKGDRSRRRFRKEILLKAQDQHISNILFSLDEILILPTFLAPPPHVEPKTTGLPDDTQSIVIPYMPDCPDIPSVYGANRLSIIEP